MTAPGAPDAASPTPIPPAEPDAAAIDARVAAALERLGIPHERMPCDPALADTAAFCAHYGVPPEQTGNTIIVASRKEPKVHAACVVLATSRLDVNHAVTRLLAVKRLSFASAEETRRVTGMLVGGVTIFGLPEEMPIYVDERVMRLPEVILGGGSRSWKLRVAPAELLRVPGIRVVKGLAQDA